MTPMHLQLVSDANGEWAAGLPAARVDPGDTEEMVVVVVVVVVRGGGAGGGGAMGHALRRAEVAARAEPKRPCVALHTRGGLRFVLRRFWAVFLTYEHMHRRCTRTHSNCP